jgi:hypothetical protein
MKHVKSTIILLLLACIVLAIVISLFTGNANGRADFEKWSNRSARVIEPADYQTKGTCSEAICSWKGVGGIGNLGIGDGNVSMMQPDAINELVESGMQSINGNKTANETASTGNVTAKNGTVSPATNPADSIIRAPASNTAGNGTLVSRNVDAQLAVPEVAADAPSTESLYPDYDLAASVIPRCAPYTITINTPFEHILAEDPVEAAALYGKLVGFTMPCGQVVDVGVKCIGYEY